MERRASSRACPERSRRVHPGRRSLSGPGITSEVNGAHASHEVLLSGISMAANAVDRQLAQLEAHRYPVGREEAARVVKLLKRLDAARFPDSSSLIRFHEALLFLRAFPQGPVVVRLTERILNSFHGKVEALRNANADMDDFDTFEVSGIAGTQMEDTLSFDVACCFINSRRMRAKVGIPWKNYEPGLLFATTVPRFIPLLQPLAFLHPAPPRP